MRLISFLTFILAAVAWAIVGAAILKLDFAHPVAIGIVWLIGFVWLAGYTAAGMEGADRLMMVWLLTMTVIAIVALIGVAFFS